MVTLYGMSEALGPISLDLGEEQHFLGRDIGLERPYGEDTADLIDNEVNQILKYCYEKAKKMLSDNIDALHTLAKSLLEKETVEGSELKALLNQA